jgi:hypothetical protein
MTIQSKTLEAAQHDWFATRSGEPANAPFSQHQFGYFASKSVKNEREWLQGVGSSSSIDPYELWVAACQAQSVPVGKSINACKFNFFTTVAAGVNP